MDMPIILYREIWCNFLCIKFQNVYFALNTFLLQMVIKSHFVVATLEGNRRNSKKFKWLFHSKIFIFSINKMNFLMCWYFATFMRRLYWQNSISFEYGLRCIFISPLLRCFLSHFWVDMKPIKTLRATRNNFRKTSVRFNDHSPADFSLWH